MVEQMAAGWVYKLVGEWDIDSVGSMVEVRVGEMGF